MATKSSMEKNHKKIAVLGIVILALCTLAYSFLDSILYMLKDWEREEYSHGYLIPIISLYFIWQKKDEILKNGFVGSWLGIAILIFGLLIGFVGIASSLYTIQQYGFLISLYGVHYILY